MDFVVLSLFVLNLPWVLYYEPSFHNFILQVVGIRFLHLIIHETLHNPCILGRNTKLLGWLCSWLCGWPFYEAFAGQHTYDHIVQQQNYVKGDVFSIATLVGIIYLPFHIRTNSHTVYLLCSCIVWMTWIYTLGFVHWFTTFIAHITSILLFTCKRLQFSIIMKHFRHPTTSFQHLNKDKMWEWFFCPIISPMMHL